MPAALSAELVALLRLRIADPRTRSDAPHGEPEGVADDAATLARLFEEQAPGTGQHWANVVEQMRAWGQNMPPMHVTRHADGSLAAFSDFPAPAPAPPATEAEFAAIEARIGRAVPPDLRQLYGLANGGFGPGLGYTPGHGQGLYSLDAVAANYDDLCRRGPDYGGTAEWPRHLLPLTDDFGPVSYDLDRGAITAFDEDWEQHGLTLERAFVDIHPSLAAWLAEWVEAPIARQGET